ncbi:hypothetical protein [uncultured Propionivibrio sp.]|uniref:hypothetical protein n=1 Tax=uncultured Propionivibrio sp. TaxID=426737 RepID=UPI0029BFF574|nr:hypothetical protein [uncultured Propionivibrio sp.]
MGIAAERKNHVPPRSREAFRPHEQKRLQLKRTVDYYIDNFDSNFGHTKVTLNANGKVTAQNACNTTTPNFGKESTAATATLSSSNPLPSPRT